MKQKKSFQNVQFSGLDEFFDFIQGDELKMVEKLRKIVLDCIPDVKEKLSYNVPFYFRHNSICFIWPGSVQWGNSKYHGVRFGFAKGYLMSDENNYLDRGNRKQIFWRDFYSVKEIDAELLRTYIYEAVMIDEENYRQKKKIRRN